MNPYNPNERIPVFTDVKFTDLFESWSLHDTNPKLKTDEIKRKNKADNKPCYIQKWLNFSHDIGRKSLNVEPKQELINWIDSGMLALEYDRIYFSVIVFENHFDLYAQYNLIIGSRLLASLPLCELPTL